MKLGKGILAIILVSRKNRWGFVFGLASQPFWFATSFINRQWGIFFLSVIYLGSWTYGTPRRNTDATKPVRSPTTPPPRQHRARFGFGQAPLARIEHRLLIQLAARIAVRALHVVGIDFQFGLGEDFRAVLQQQRIVLHLGVGLLRRPLDQELALKHAAPLAPRDGPNQLAHFAAFGMQRHAAGLVCMLSGFRQAHAIYPHARVFANKIDLRLDARIFRAGRQHELAKFSRASDAHLAMRRRHAIAASKRD